MARFSFAIAGAVVLCAVLVIPAHAYAAPVSYYQLPGSTNEWIDGLTAGNDGTLWVAQSLSSGPANSERHSRILHLGATGNVIGATLAEEGDPYAIQLAPSTDGGAWESSFATKLRHIDAGGASQEITLPQGTVYPETLAAGQDGRAWAARCEFIFGEPYEERCSAVAASLNGAVQEVPMPGISTRWPAGATSSGGYIGSVPTSTGIWFWRLWGFNGTAPTASAEFVSYAGAVSAANLPAESRLVAPAPGGSAWWIQDEGKSGATLGQIAPSGITSDVHHMANVSEIDPPDPFVGDPGRNGNLVWAQNATWSERYDGQIGVARPDGSNTEYKVEKDATDVPTNIPNFWSGTCNFGVRLYEAIDGSLWTISGGHPSRVTRQQPSGTFETYLLGGGASEFAGEKETGVWGMVETNPRALYFSLNTPSGPELARLDPLDPPPAEPRYPGHGAVDRGLSAAQRIKRLLRSMIQQTRRSLDRLQRGDDKSRIRVAFPARGTASVAIKKVGRRGPSMLSATTSGDRGIHSMYLRFRPGVMSLLRNASREQGTVTVTFTPAGGTPAHRTAKIGL